jgi:O-acetyl-ADP-ribose deacetylase (regulator of RNase III)
MFIEKFGDVTKAEEQYICHQCNCVSKNVAGLAKTIFTLWPQCNRQHLNNVPGTISVHKIDDGKAVINMYAQYYPGYPSTKDNAAMRKYWFQQCLAEIKLLTPKSVAFPARIGCGLAGGNWDDYLNMLKDFHDQLIVDVTVYDIGS